MKTATMTCPKCLGSKRFARHAHIENGVCFFCRGAGTIQVRDVPAAPVEHRVCDHAHELRNLFRAARSQGRDWADEDDGYDVTVTVGYHLARVDAETAAKAVAAFASVLTPAGAARIRAAFRAASQKMAA